MITEEVALRKSLETLKVQMVATVLSTILLGACTAIHQGIHPLTYLIKEYARFVLHLLSKYSCMLGFILGSGHSRTFNIEPSRAGAVALQDLEENSCTSLRPCIWQH